MAFGFFRGWDFETCLSALKSREIKERGRGQPKPGEHVWMREDDERTGLSKGRRECTEYTKDRQDGREVWQKVVRRSYTRTRSFIRYSRSSYSPSPGSIRSPPLFYSRVLRPAVASFNIPSRGMCHTQTLGATKLYQAWIHCVYISHSLDLDRFGCFFDRELIPRSLDRTLLLRSHKRARPRIEWLVMGVNYA